MSTVVFNETPQLVVEWLEQRRKLGQDLFDEVWAGDYHVAPAIHGRHGFVDSELGELLGPSARAAGLWGSGPCNIGEPDDYRVPDRAYLRDKHPEAFEPTAAIVVEVVSPGDETYAKLDFYFAHGVEELLIADPLRRSVQWYGRGPSAFERTDRSRILHLSEADLAAIIVWPPTD